jgi:hypothetical protein
MVVVGPYYRPGQKRNRVNWRKLAHLVLRSARKCSAHAGQVNECNNAVVREGTGVYVMPSFFISSLVTCSAAVSLPIFAELW